VQSDSIDVRYVARLARIALTDEEVDRFSEQLVDLLHHVDALAELDTNIVAATAQVVESRNVMRADEPRPCLDRTTVLEQAPRSQGNFFRVPRIIAE
jgi:aspartyl-tRNA(Asn)/glutamyl-tRNA(Gln) amidotransferase subunit C